MSDSVVVVEQTTPVVQVTYPAAGVVQVLRSEFGVDVENVCDVVVVGDTPTSVEVGVVDQVETSEVNVVVEVAETGVSVISVGEQGPTAEDTVRYQEVGDIEVVGNGPAEVTTIWKGEALPGILTSQPLWRIRKIILQSGGDDDYVLNWADGTAAFSKVWEATPGDELYKTYDFTP